ncbi:MAG: Taurine--pyruvate aminotransferase [Alphaproteobacteria bacterium MarineAlpha5_Bin11]|nr:aspartate aminotransferase family protein [Pelagibacteraceae bacterium]PPR42737.1 MAG: Taurine--pyruvate aminotransferase [Alphaproteobacteria bacterium MarineAlpha5_Bin11]PPR51331.1 MAG: Taurine--pyruvate aminotransferase [Alphaproteobacteria bacterium MarineAlpha5_Bin10]|tara:strand:- start:10936 stop:12315 length:1380 start_codon:yes stop_codon:yes gene_type:complete
MHLLNRNTRQWQEIDSAHHLHPFTDHQLLEKTGSRVITSAKGSYIKDSENNEILDMMAGLWCVNIGYGRNELAEVAKEQMELLPYYNTFFKTATTPAIELGRILSEITPKGIEHFFYGSSGSESNDTLVRLVRRYWDILGKKNKKTFITRTYAYHGSTMASASLGGMEAMHSQGDLPLPGFVHVMPPYHYKFGKELTEDEFTVLAVKEIENKILELGQDNIAAFMGEPIQGAGGVIVPPPNYWSLVQDLCKKYDILLCVDEVICGFGRTGEWFGSQHFKIDPDIITFAKGITSGYLPLSGIGIGKRVSETFINKGGEFYHGYTYSGHPVACAVAIENIRIIKDEGMIENVKKNTAPYLQKRMREFENHPLVGEVRGQGLLAGVELVKNKEKKELFDPPGKVGNICRDHCMNNNLIMRAVRDGMMCSPPLSVTKDDIDECIVRLKKSLDLTLSDVKRLGL